MLIISPLLNWYFHLSCTSLQKQEVEHEELKIVDRDIVSDFQADPKQVLSEILVVSDPLLQESLLLEIIEANPMQSRELCIHIQSDAGKGKCRRFQERPHLWSIANTSQQFWTEGMFFERVLFPKIPEQSIDIAEQFSCSDRICVEKNIQLFASEGNISGIWNNCQILAHSSKGKSDCLFRSAELLDVQHYGSALWLCQNAHPFQPECHNHVLLHIVHQGDIYVERHQSNINRILDFWKEHPTYQKEIENVYWSLVASRMVGSLQPLEYKWIQPYLNHLFPFLNNALAFRLISSPTPLEDYDKLMSGTTINPPKTPSPEHPLFISQRFQSTSGVYLCDFRCGKRSIRNNQREDFILALYYVAHMYKNGSQLQKELQTKYSFLPTKL